MRGEEGKGRCASQTKDAEKAGDYGNKREI